MVVVDLFFNRILAAECFNGCLYLTLNGGMVYMSPSCVRKGKTLWLFLPMSCSILGLYYHDETNSWTKAYVQALTVKLETRFALRQFGGQTRKCITWETVMRQKGGTEGKGERNAEREWGGQGGEQISKKESSITTFSIIRRLTLFLTWALCA